MKLNSQSFIHPGHGHLLIPFTDSQVLGFGAAVVHRTSCSCPHEDEHLRETQVPTRSQHKQIPAIHSKYKGRIHEGRQQGRVRSAVFREGSSEMGWIRRMSGCVGRG